MEEKVEEWLDKQYGMYNDRVPKDPVEKHKHLEYELEVLNIVHGSSQMTNYSDKLKYIDIDRKIKLFYENIQQDLCESSLESSLEISKKGKRVEEPEVPLTQTEKELKKIRKGSKYYGTYEIPQKKMKKSETVSSETAVPHGYPVLKYTFLF